MRLPEITGRKYMPAIAVLCILMLSCRGRYRFREVSEFSIQADALKDREIVKVLYSGNGPEGEKEPYYVHLLVVSQHTGDTVNVLSRVNPRLKAEDNGKDFIYMKENNPAALLLMAAVPGLDRGASVGRVARDPEFDAVAYNSYPTVIGLVAWIQSEKGIQAP